MSMVRAPNYAGGGMVPLSNFGDSGLMGLISTAMNRNAFTSGLGGILGGLFGDSSAPYEAASKKYAEFGKKGENAINPFYSAGAGAIPDFQKWLQGMQNPQEFINKLMGGYSESPFAKFQQQQAIRSAQNLGSASGLTGSTPLAMQLQQNASNISSEDMQKYLANVLGVNSAYGGGLSSLVSGGQNAANSLLDLFKSLAEREGEAAYGKEAGKTQDLSSLIGGGLSLASLFI